MFVDPFASVQLVREGKLRALGVTTARRVSTAPELPPLAEVGLPGYDAASWHMFVAPAATPKPIVQRLYAEIDAIIKEPDVAAEIGKRGFEPSAGGPPEAACAVRATRDRALGQGGARGRRRRDRVGSGMRARARSALGLAIAGAVRARGFARIRAGAGLSQPRRDHRGAGGAGRALQPVRAADRQQARAASGQAVHRREPAGRKLDRRRDVGDPRARTTAIR